MAILVSIAWTRLYSSCTLADAAPPGAAAAGVANTQCHYYRPAAAAADCRRPRYLMTYPWEWKSWTRLSGAFRMTCLQFCGMCTNIPIARLPKTVEDLFIQARIHSRLETPNPSNVSGWGQLAHSLKSKFSS